MVGDRSIFGQSLAQLGSGQNHAVFLAVRAGAQGGHAVALVAVEGPVDLHGRGARGAEEKKRSAGLEKTIVDLERRKRNLLLAVEEGAMSMGDVRTRLEELNKQITEIRKDLQKIHDILRPIPPVGE